ncbi:serine/threonine-protein kinase [Frankia sp. AgB32]|uniref:serine/threonine-protein kinase n=1 Tax=Frankia sp. AgB32 TaxID=631119 RepID=UPI002010A474|nr:serine/threonine-protein kinase [Frankia sp. AgB32]MCK9894155.1 protein kinase [Frankia sp. AgB32]
MFVERGQVEAALPGYELGGTLGQGASGVVLEARHRQISRQVAVKVLTRAGQEARAGFRQEAEVLAGLDHPHIVRIYDYVERGDLSLLIMEHLAGGTLRARPATTTAAACAVGLAAAAARGAAPAAGVLHRDIKPANILFARDGAPKLVDFGISRFFGGSGTSVHSIAGTPGYMAPEQIGGGRVGAGTDLYALGVVLFRLLSGRMPIDPRLPPAQVWKRQLDDPAPAPPGVAGPLAAVISQALRRRRDDRQRSAQEFARQLAQAATAVLGPGWLAASGITVRAERDILDPAQGHPGRHPDHAPADPVPPAPRSAGSASATASASASAPASPTAFIPAGDRPSVPPASGLDAPSPPPRAGRAASPPARTPETPSALVENQPAPDRAQDPPSSRKPPVPSQPTPWPPAPNSAEPAPPPYGGAVGASPRSVDRDGDALVVETATGTRGSERVGTRRGVVLAMAVGLVVMVVAALVLLDPFGSGGGGGRADPTTAGSGQPSASTSGTAVAHLGVRVLGPPATGAGDGGPPGAADPAGASGAIVASVAVGADGVEVAVGRRAPSLGGNDPERSTPVAWRSADGHRWQAVAVPLPPGTASGAISAVTFLDGRGFVAVGSTAIGSDRTPTGTTRSGGASEGTGDSQQANRPAVWRSADGQRWDAIAGSAGLTGDVTGLLARGGELLAVGRPGGPLGGGAVWRSADGSAWTRVTTPTLGGPAEQHVDHLVELADGSLLAAGTEVSGSATVTRLRHSTDGARWNLATTALPAGVVLAGMARLPDGRILAVGSTGGGAFGTRPVLLLGDRQGDHWTTYQVASAVRTELFGVGVLGGTVQVAGAVAGADGASPQAGVWTVTPPA